MNHTPKTLTIQATFLLPDDLTIEQIEKVLSVTMKDAFSDDLPCQYVAIPDYEARVEMLHTDLIADIRTEMLRLNRPVSINETELQHYPDNGFIERVQYEDSFFLDQSSGVMVHADEDESLAHHLHVGDISIADAHQLLLDLKKIKE